MRTLLFFKGWCPNEDAPQKFTAPGWGFFFYTDTDSSLEDAAKNVIGQQIQSYGQDPPSTIFIYEFDKDEHQPKRGGIKLKFKRSDLSFPWPDGKQAHTFTYDLVSDSRDE